MNVRLKTAIDVVSTLLVCVAAAFVVWAQAEARWVTPARTEQIQNIERLGLTLDVEKLSHVRGSSDLVLVEFTDYECPFCGRHAREVAPALRDRPVGSRLLRHAVLNFPLMHLHSRALPAAVAAECGGKQGRFWEMHDRLFAEKARLSDTGLQEAAQDVGLDMAAFALCLEEAEEPQIARDIEEGKRLGVNSTPTFFLGRLSDDGLRLTLTRRVRGLLAAEDMEGMLDQASEQGEVILSTSAG